MKIIIKESQFNRILSERFRFPKVSAPKARPAVQSAKPISPLRQQVESLKPNYIKQFGQQKYNELVSKLTSKQISKEQFLKELSSKKITGVVQGVKGVVMTPEEITKITKMSEKIVAGQYPSGTIQLKKGSSIEDVVVNFVRQNNNTVAIAGITKDWGPKLTINVKNLPKNKEEVKRTLYHELTHMKDPAPQILKQNKTGQYYMKGSGSQYANQADKVMSRIKEIEKNTPKGQPYPKEYYDLKNQHSKLFSKYEYSPKEKTANFQMIYNSIPDKINAILKDYSLKFGKKKATETLDSILGYLKGKGGNIQTIIGQRQVDYLNNLKKVDVNQYNDLVKKITQQVESIRTQL
jgi:hypothetical protein